MSTKALNSPTLRELGDYFRDVIGYQVTYDDVQTEGVISSLTVEAPVFGSDAITMTVTFLELLVKGEGMLSFFTHIKDGSAAKPDEDSAPLLSRLCITGRVRNTTSIAESCEKYSRWAFQPQSATMHRTLHEVLAKELSDATGEPPIPFVTTDLDSGKQYGYGQIALMLQQAEAFALSRQP